MTKLNCLLHGSDEYVPYIECWNTNSGPGYYPTIELYNEINNQQPAWDRTWSGGGGQGWGVQFYCNHQQVLSFGGGSGGGVNFKTDSPAWQGGGGVGVQISQHNPNSFGCKCHFKFDFCEKCFKRSRGIRIWNNSFLTFFLI